MCYFCHTLIRSARLNGKWARAKEKHNCFSTPGSGFTLVDLLVVIAIMSLMLAILLPAVQSAREAVRRVECKNNIKQLALSCHNHHDVHGHFPTGGWGWYWVGDADRGFGQDQPGGWIFNLLPYFEQYTLYGQSSDGSPDVLTRQQRAGAAQIIETPLSIINCPSRRTNSLYPMTANEGGDLGYFNSLTPHRAGRSDYAINSGHLYNEWPDHKLGQGPGSYDDARVWSVNRYWGGEQGALFKFSAVDQTMSGISFERSMVAIRHVTDGLAYTYLIGEKALSQQDYETGRSQGDNETWCTGFNNDNYRRTGQLTNGQITECRPLRDGNRSEVDYNGRFGSSHPTGWNVAFCDGSVRTVDYDIDWQVHCDLGNRMDGNTIKLPW